MKRILAFVFAAVLFVAPGVHARGAGTSSSSSHSASSSTGNHYIHGYTTKNGTYVEGHYAANPSGAKTESSKGIGGCELTPAECSHKDLSTRARDSRGRIKRSATAKREFERDHACPSTGKTSGSCPGYVIDHVRPLCKGGADHPSNMQWQTIAAGRAKDRVECKKG
jgi:hypothetical protein